MDKRTRVILITVSITAVLVLGIYLWMHYSRASKIEKFLANMCTDESVDKSYKDVFDAVRDVQDCKYGQSSHAWSLAFLSDYELIEKLTSLCVETPGGITTADRLTNQLKAIDGKGQSSEEMCRAKVIDEFPELR